LKVEDRFIRAAMLQLDLIARLDWQDSIQRRCPPLRPKKTLREAFENPRNILARPRDLRFAQRFLRPQRAAPGSHGGTDMAAMSRRAAPCRPMARLAAMSSA
jgi:hypothetical protein